MTHRIGDSYSKVLVPQMGVNDDSVVVVEYLKKEGDRVAKDDAVVTVETTKVCFDINCENDGFFLPCCELGAEVPVNAPIGYIFHSVEDLNHFNKNKEQSLAFTQRHNKTTASLNEGTSASITQKAQALIAQYSLDAAEIKAAGSIIRESDVLRHLALTKKSAQLPSFVKEKKQVIIYGCGNGARTVKETLSFHEDFQVVGFIADREKYDSEIQGLPVLDPYDPQELKKQNILYVALAITDTVKRLSIFKELEKSGFVVISAIHPRAYISQSAQIGNGNHVKAGALIDTNTIVGCACIIDNNVTVAHDNVIEDGVHLAPGVTLGSSIKVGRNSIIGIGSSISTGINIGEYCIVSVGSSVTTDVPSMSVVEGVPGKVIGKRKV